MKLGLVDRGFAHHTRTKFSNEFCTPSKPFEWDRSYSGDWVVFTDFSIPESWKLSFKNKKKIAWLMEPRAIQYNNYNITSQIADSFEFIFSSDLDWVSSLRNGVYIPYGGTWIYPKDWSCYEREKTGKCSIIASEKKYMPGHIIRHQIIQKLEGFDVYGRQINPIEYKLTGLKRYKYQIVVENVMVNGWFTEKIIDCFLTGTIPIYYGSPLPMFHDGILRFNTIDELRDILSDPPQITQDIIKYNFFKAKNYVLPENFIWEFLKDKI